MERKEQLEMKVGCKKKRVFVRKEFFVCECGREREFLGWFALHDHAVRERVRCERKSSVWFIQIILFK